MPESKQQAERLAVLTQRVGFALWQLQAAEGVAALYLAMLAQATKGMGARVGRALAEKVQSKTVGATIKELEKPLYYLGADAILTDPSPTIEIRQWKTVCIVNGWDNEFRQPGSKSHQRQQFFSKWDNFRSAATDRQVRTRSRPTE